MQRVGSIDNNGDVSDVLKTEDALTNMAELSNGKK